ncbi:MAG: hypothetical protein ACXVBE_12765 [Bdellovibrionota bacterium]
MKNVYLFALASVLLSLNAQAEVNVIARIVTSGGMPGYHQTCNSSEVKVLDNGQVIATRCGQNGRELALLAEGVVKKLATDISALKISALVPEDPAHPQCEDAPGTQYLVSQGSKEVAIGGESGCRPMVMEGAAGYDAAGLVTLLAGLKILDRY